MAPLPDFAPTVRRRVVVTGIGMVTPLGVGTRATWAALCRGETGTRSLNEVPFFLPSYIADNKRVSDDEKREMLAALIKAMPCRVAAPVAHTGDKRFDPTPHESRASRLCAAAVAEALHQAGLLETVSDTSLQIGRQSSDRVGVNIGMGIPSLSDVTDVAASLITDKKINYSCVNPFFVPKILGNMAAGTTAIKYGATGPIGSNVAACATGAHCIGEAASWIRHNRADIVVCGATEACLTPVGIAGFSRMRALCTKYNDNPSMASRPFDEQRGGFIMGEGAGILVLEDYESAKQRGVASILAEVRGFGVSCDAHHVAAPHPEGRGARRCMEDALADAGDIPVEMVGYVNAHATGTIGDPIELAAIAAALRTAGRSDPLRISSSKGALGHLLGAAGSAEAGIAVMALHEGVAPPTANLESPCVTAAEQAARGISLVSTTNATDAKLPAACEATMSTSFGFGGINTSLVFTQPPC